MARSFRPSSVGGGDGLSSLADIWCQYTIDGTLGADFVIAGRTNRMAELNRWLQGADIQPILRIYGQSYTEIHHFIAACVAGMPSAEREMRFQRIIVVEHDNAASTLPVIHRECVIVANEGTAIPRVKRIAKETGCRVILCSVDGRPRPLPTNPDFSVVELVPADRNTVVQLVVEQRYQQKDAVTICGDCDFDYVKIRKTIFCC